MERPLKNSKNKRLHPKYKRRRIVLLLVGAALVFLCFYGTAKIIEKAAKTTMAVPLGLSSTDELTKKAEPLDTEPVEEMSNISDSYPKIETDLVADSDQSDIIKRIAMANWETTIVNKTYPLDASFSVNLESISVDLMVDERIANNIKQMIIQAKSEGVNLEIYSAYISSEQQEEIYNQELENLLSKGRTAENAKKMLENKIPVPWLSEHHTGLAIDISLPALGINKTFDKTLEFQWLQDNGAKYGFVLRYPKDKESVTGMEYTPHHFRYVGADIAEYIVAHNFTLEEYIYMQEQKLNEKIIEKEETEDPEILEEAEIAAEIITEE